MVKLSVIPDPKVIRAFRGNVDFYSWKGIAIARSWPKKPDQSQAPNIRLNQPHLTDATVAYRTLHIRLLLDLRYQASFGTFTSRDIFMKHYFGTSLTTIGMSSRATHQHLYGRGPALLGLLRGRNLRLAAQTHTPETVHRPPPAFPHPDPYEHYWYVRRFGVTMATEGEVGVFIHASRPGRYILTTARSLPSLTWIRSRRRGILRTNYPDWVDNDASAFLSEVATDERNRVEWNLGAIQRFRPNQYTTLVVTRKHENTGVECWSRSPMFTLFLRPEQDYIDGFGLPPGEWGTPRPVGPHFATGFSPNFSLPPHLFTWPPSNDPPEPPFWG